MDKATETPKQGRVTEPAPTVRRQHLTPKRYLGYQIILLQGLQPLVQSFPTFISVCQAVFTTVSLARSLAKNRRSSKSLLRGVYATSCRYPLSGIEAPSQVE